MIRSSEYGVTEVHKIMWLRVVEGMYTMFRCVPQTANIIRKMQEEHTFIDECVDKSLAFLKSLPNSGQYWVDLKKDLFAMICQLGKASMFRTLNTNEIRWP
ncbi:helitron_like_N domain-containing protein [Trichonephila clavata]|uniref:Helitron_like_N domain-containing protein n=1 Tax=Trichonephila clavata TaxID=2740835 RepID=A0A8X6LJ04_TRICU|nr:helitron_like_N domain-containing protein [Trichonephila clavata]